MKLWKSRVLVCVALSTILGIGVLGPTDAALFGLWKSKRKPSVVGKQSVTVFPFDQEEVARVPAAFGEFVASDLRYVLADSDRFCAVVLFKERLSPITRALADNTLRSADVAPPFSEEKEKPLKLAELLASDLFVIGSIDDFQVDTAKKVAVVTLSAQLVDTKTGKLLKTLLVTGRTGENVDTAEEDELRDMAKGDAVTKLSAEILALKKTPESAPDAPAPPPEASTKPAAPPDAGKDVSKPAEEKPAEKPEDKAAKNAAD